MLRRHGQGAHRFFQIQEAEVVLASLAQHDLFRLLRRVGKKPIQLAVNLVLQVAGEGGKPDRALVLLGPDRRRGDIAQGLADAGAGLGQYEIRLADLVARDEALADRGGVVLLLRTGFRIRAEQVGEARAGPRRW